MYSVYGSIVTPLSSLQAILCHKMNSQLNQSDRYRRNKFEERKSMQDYWRVSRCSLVSSSFSSCLALTTSMMGLTLVLTSPGSSSTASVGFLQWVQLGEYHYATVRSGVLPPVADENQSPGLGVRTILYLCSSDMIGNNILPSRPT